MSFRRKFLGSKTKLGITLAELIVALGILAFVGLTIIAVFIALIQASSKGREQSQAGLLAERLLEKACAQGPNQWGVEGHIGVRQQIKMENDGTLFFYQVDRTPLTSLSSALGEVGKSWEVTVTVGWWQKDSAGSLEDSRLGFGNQYVKATRIVYFRDSSRW